MSEKETYHACSSKTRPDKNLSGGYGNYCCVPGCKSAVYNSRREKTGISMFKLPTKDPERRSWLKVLKNVRRKGGADTFDPSKRIYVCEFHFKLEDVRVTLGMGRKKIIQGRLPSVFPSKKPTVKRKRKSPLKRSLPKQSIMESETEESIMESETEESIMESETEESIVESETEESIMESETEESIVESDESLIVASLPGPISSPVDNENETEFDKLRAQHSELKERVQQLEELNTFLHEKNTFLQEENTQLQDSIYSYENLSKNKDKFRIATGLEPDNFKALYKYLNPGENCCNIKLYDTAKRLSEEKFTTNEDKDKLKHGRKPKLSAINQLFLYVTWLKNGFSISHTAWLFKISKATVSRYLITWTNFCYFSLGSILIWPTREQVDNIMPECFKRTYSSTRCIIDCTELYCQRPSSLATQSSLYSHYKSHVTYKGLLGISPSGAITFISQLFDGSISDKEIVRQSGFLEKSLWSPGDSVMADRGFTIEEDLKPLNVALNIPSFLRGRSQLNIAEVKESQTIASVRIHVERAIQRVKKFKILRNEIPLTLHGSVNQIWTVCLLCNLLPPLIQKGYGSS